MEMNRYLSCMAKCLSGSFGLVSFSFTTVHLVVVPIFFLCVVIAVMCLLYGFVFLFCFVSILHCANYHLCH